MKGAAGVKAFPPVPFFGTGEILPKIKMKFAKE